MEPVWRVLVVDDEEDIHAVTKLGLKYKVWQNKKFEVVSAFSGEEARELIKQTPSPFDVALVDVVMEKDDTGLKLCEYIRQTCPSSTRIVLRTGQPGYAPEEPVMTDYDIDYYLAKQEATEKRLFSVIRACLRSSVEISTLLTVDNQLRGLTRAIRYAPTLDELAEVMGRSIAFLEGKHSCRAVFVSDLTLGDQGVCPRSSSEAGDGFDLPKIFEALNAIHRDKRGLNEPHAGKTFGLTGNAFVEAVNVLEGAREQRVKENLGQKLYRVFTQPPGATAPTEETVKTVDGGIYVRFSPDTFSPSHRRASPISSAMPTASSRTGSSPTASSASCKTTPTSEPSTRKPRGGGKDSWAPASRRRHASSSLRKPRR
jgi:CheY-like chemotaxis protein